MAILLQKSIANGYADTGERQGVTPEAHGQGRVSECDVYIIGRPSLRCKSAKGLAFPMPSSYMLTSHSGNIGGAVVQARKGEGDRHIPTLRPKHLLVGHRGKGKTDRR